jgi:hypothetical protein
MANYSTKKIDSGFWLSFQIHGDGSELFEYGLPTPTHYERANNSSYGVYWLLDGYFHTKRGRDYLNDTISRLSAVCKISSRLDSPYRPKGVSVDRGLINLSQFGGLPSLRTRSAQYLNTSKYEDNVFWAIKLEAIGRIRAVGWLDRSGLESWAFDVFLIGEHVKDKSTLRAKCRSIFEWYEVRNWRIDERVSTMSRIEGAAKATAIRQARIKASIQGAINVLKLYGTKITVRSLAEEAGISKSTAQKYLNEIKASGGLGDSPSKAVAVELFTQSLEEVEAVRGLDTPELGKEIPSFREQRKEKEKAEYKARIEREAEDRAVKKRLTRSAAGFLLNRDKYIK